MLLHNQNNSYRVQVLLDTGCSINLINQQMVQRLNLRKYPHKNPRIIESFTGQTIETVGQFHTGRYDYNTGNISLERLSKSLQLRKEST